MCLKPESLLYSFLYETTAMVSHIVDADGIVMFVNKKYVEILGMTEDEVVGHAIADITPNTRTVQVRKTGKGIIGYNWTVNGHKMIASCIPLFHEDKFMGCFSYSIVMDIWDAKDLAENVINELNMYRDEVISIYSARYSFTDIIGENEKMQTVKELAQKAALHPNITVLIKGESGTGKELFAHAIHQAGSRSKMPFVRVNCAAIPEHLLEAELFGYEDGAFTGARKGGSRGKFELAHGGTIFLDEIAEMPTAMQSKLLVFLQEKEFERLGGHKPIRVNVRVIAATNRDLKEMIRQEKFREDLYYRLDVLRLDIPPLRARIDDLPLLIDYIIPCINNEMKTRVSAISREGCQLIQQYRWPGNVRELRNVVQRAMLLADLNNESVITDKHLSFLNVPSSHESAQRSLREQIKDYEKQIIAGALAANSFNKTQTAEVLDMDLSSLYKKVKTYGLMEDN